MRTWEPYHAPDLTGKAKVCPKCGERPTLKKNPAEWEFVFGCPNACALQSDKLGISRLGERDEETFGYELGFGFENMRNRLLAWWNGL
jgi:hypothetical protein